MKNTSNKVPTANEIKLGLVKFYNDDNKPKGKIEKSKFKPAPKGDNGETLINCYLLEQ